MKAEEIRKKYIEYFKKIGHKEIKGASLIPENDPSVLFTTAGMHPLVPYLLGEKHPEGKRLVNYQKCIRTGDIDEVGNTTHNTFFEMLGNWSLNDYFKDESIEYSFKFLTEELGIKKENLAVTVFAGDADAPFDEVSYNAWIKCGISPKRIAKLDKKENWWPTGGKLPGPQGPDTEIFYYVGGEEIPEVYDPEDKHWVEIWNNVFMEYKKTESGSYEKLDVHNVDTGMGFERISLIMEKKSSIYETSIFKSIMDEIKNKAENYEIVSARIIADHLRASIFIIADGIIPSNVDQGYILRRLLRRTVRHCVKIGFDLEELPSLIITIVDTKREVYPYLTEKQDHIIKTILDEKNKFIKTLEKGEKRLTRIIEEYKKQDINVIPGKVVFNLYDTYGFPPQITEEIAKENNMTVNIEKYEELFNEHQEKSRTGAAGKFKGGLADDNESTTKLHTATHLLNQALKDVLGPEIHQMGSNITSERLRFDFPYPEKVSIEQLAQVESIINEQIKKELDIVITEMTKEEAINEGAEATFIEKYGNQVKVYKIGDYSKEICGGPHVENTRELGKFKIVKEQSSSAGVRRIKAVLE